MKIVVLDGYAANPGDLSWDALAKLGELKIYDRSAPSEVIDRIGDAEIVLVNKVAINRAILEACPSIRMIGVLATGYNIVDVAAAKEHNVCVCNIPAYSTASVAQLTFALLLEICHHVGDHSIACHDGTWERNPDFCFWLHPLTELAGKTLGIIGYGQIGQAVGKIALAFGMKLLVCARHVRPELESENCHYATLDEVLAQSDVISLHCPQFAETTGMINAASIAKMKDGAILINTSRGGLIVEQDLADALRSGKLRAAAVDVVSQEPIVANNPLLTAPNCFMTPHIAWAPKESRQRLMDIAEENVRCFIAGKPINRVN